MAQFTNQAQLTYNGITVNSNVVVGDIQEVLSANKVALSDTYTQSGDIAYAVSVVNSGNLPVTGVTVTDDLGGYPFGTPEGTIYPLRYVDGSVKLYINGVLQASPTVTAGPPLVFSDITIPANSSMVLLYEADVTQFAPLDADGSIVNTATVTGAGISAPVTATETVTPVQGANLTITKSISPVPVVENGLLTYTFLIQNYGNTELAATDGVIVTDTFNPILSGLSVILNGTPLAQGTGYTYSETNGLFSTLSGAIPVPAATYTQDPVTGEITVTPGTATLVVTGTV